MNPFQRLVFFLALIVFLGSPVAVAHPKAAAAETCRMGSVEDALLIGLVEVGNDPVEGILPAEKVKKIPGLNVWRVNVPPGRGASEAARLRLDKHVAYVESDYRVCAEGADTAWPAQPDDTYYGQQWALEQIHAQEAWSVTTGSGEILVGIVDSGVQIDHPDLTNRLWTNPGEIPGNRLDDDGNGKVDDMHGWHFFHHEVTKGVYEEIEDNRIGDEFGHGTHVAGIVAAETNNGKGVAGVTWQGKLLVVKVLDASGNGWNSDIAAGIVYAVDMGAKVINLSLGGKSPSQTLKASIDYAVERGALVVAATGNSAEPVYYPAAYENVLAVAATDDQDRRARFSNYGPQVDLAAPGVDIHSTWYLGNYFTKSGTSMAAPFVSGAAALIWSRWPDFTPEQIASVLKDSTIDVGAPGFDPFTGHGRIDVLEALAALEPLSDLWVELEAPAYALQGDTAQFTIRFGNRGGAASTDVWITASLLDGVEPSSAGRWYLESLPPSGDVFTQTLPFTVTTDAAMLTTMVRIRGSGGERSFADTSDSAETRVGYPLATFAASSSVVRSADVVSFTNTTLGALPISYTWDFGDGETSELENPKHTYSDPGVYTVVLTAVNPYGRDEHTGVITVVPRQVFLPFMILEPRIR